MCSGFIRFFGNIHNGCMNRVMTDFRLTDDYSVCDGLDQEEVKRQEAVCGYRLNSYYVAKTGCVDSQNGFTSFFAADAFVDDTIWVGSSQAATQYIFNIANEFFRLNNISINNNKTVAIPINYRVAVPFLSISNAPISIAKKRVSHYYLGVFLFSNELSKPSLAKAHSDVWFFANLVLKKAISDKQFSYLVSAVLHSIIGYRIQFSFVSASVCQKWDVLIRKSLKLKLGLLLNFFNDVLYHFLFYGLKTFKQIQAKNKVAAVVCFTNSVLSWHSVHLLCSPVRISVNPLNNFLVGVQWKRLDLRGPVPAWFAVAVRHFYVAGFFNVGSSFLVATSVKDILDSYEFRLVCNQLSGLSASNFFVYTDNSFCGLGSMNIKAGATAFFENINLAIALALKCVLSSSSVHLFSNSQAALDACKSELLLLAPDFRNKCWVKDYLSVLGNNRTDLLVSISSHSGWLFYPWLKKCFILANDNTVSRNSKHFVYDIFWSIHRASWKVGSGAKIVNGYIFSDIDWFKSSLVWHLDFYMTAGFTNYCSAGSHSYFMKALHYRLPVAIQKRLYDRCYSSVVCLYCSDVELSDYVFSYAFDVTAWFQLFVDFAST
ncbi:hypothetical protein G9A89_003436 [Geosiphon pyriformis]|nr:hypothetical protein G9A89_003436 [Geosiphon pyriformis]